jgi:hypothetical protein
LNNIQNLLENIKNPIQNVNNVQNNVNVQINNTYISKKDKLNSYYKDMIDIDTFTDNYKNNTKYHLTKDEAKVLLENSENMGIPTYGEGLYTYLKKKYCLQLEDLTGKEVKHYESILPFINNDTNLRSHYELTKDGWSLVKTNDKIKKIVNISDQQIFEHHNKFICYSSKKGKNTVVNIFLRKSDYSNIEPTLNTLTTIDPKN